MGTHNIHVCFHGEMKRENQPYTPLIWSYAQFLFTLKIKENKFSIVILNIWTA